MNALINAINEKTKIILENDGRLLKKSFFGLLLLSLVFQGGEFGEVIRSSMIDAYIQVSVFVGLAAPIPHLPANAHPAISRAAI